MMPGQKEALASLKEQQVMEQDDELNKLQELVDELAAVQTQVDEAPVEEVSSPEDQIKQDILSLFKDTKDAPDDVQIQFWKEKYGANSIRLFALDETNIYIYSYLSLEQWESIQALMQKLAGTPKAVEAEKLIKEHVIKTAVLWPKEVLPALRKRAGLSDAIYQLIMINSYFLTPQQAMTMTVQL